MEHDRDPFAAGSNSLGFNWILAADWNLSSFHAYTTGVCIAVMHCFVCHFL